MKSNKQIINDVLCDAAIDGKNLIDLLTGQK